MSINCQCYLDTITHKIFTFILCFKIIDHFRKMFCCGKSSKAKKLKNSSAKYSEPPTLPASQKTSLTKLQNAIVQEPGKEALQLDNNNETRRILSHPKEYSGKNILEDSKVLTTILSYLNINELLHARLVNKLWNKVACELLREKMDGVIILQRGLGYYTRVMSESNDIPIGRIFLNILDMDESEPQTFFKTIGHSVHYLILNLEGHSVSQFQANLHYLRSLKQLSLNLFNEFGKESMSENEGTKQRKVSEVHIFIEDFGESNNNKPFDLRLPNLESIIVSSELTWKRNEPFLLEQLVRAATNLKNLNLQKWPFPVKKDLFDKASLQNLTFLTAGYLGNQELKTLAGKGLSLKSAEFQLDYDVEGETLDSFLESISNSVEYLRIESKSNKNLVFRLQTKKPRLMIVRLTHWVGPILLDTLAGNCERLMKIQLGNCDPGSITLKHPKSNVNVKYLAVNFGHFSTVSVKIRSEVVKHFIYAFPELESFMMRQVSDKTLGQIVNGWPKLKTLRVTSAFGLTDSGLSGISMTELSKMTKLEYKLSCGCCLPVHVVDLKPYVDNVRQYPHIGKLTNLTDLSIESEEGSHFPLTNFSLHLGLHELTKLTSLKITCHNELGPHWCLKIIADSFPNLKELTVMDRAISHDRYEEHEVLYLLKRLPNLKLRFVPTNVEHHLTKLF